MALPTIHIGSKLDAKGFKQAETALTKLTKGAKSLASALGIAYSTRALVNYAKSSMKAAAQDEKSQKLLATNLKNLGLAYADVDAEKFIKSMETQTHIADDLLRPAYAQLARVTNSAALSQKIMTVAFDASSGSGLSYQQTIDALSQAYVGNTKGLKQLNLGLTNTELAALSFDQLLQLLTKHFAGDGLSAVSGYQGKMDALTISLGNVQEILGGALLDSFSQLAGNGDITKATSKMEKLAQSFADVLRVMTGVYKLNAIMDQVTFGGFLGIVPKDKPKNYIPMQSPGSRLQIDAANKAARDKRAADAKAAAALLAAQKKSAAELLAQQKKIQAALKNTQELKTASAQFDLKQISIAAALKNTYDQDTKLRLLAMQAIENDNGQAAIDYLKQLNILQESVQADKLKGITTVSNAQLVALNTVLLAEIDGINKTSMSDKDKQQARLEAFAKYNDAITKQGGLAALNSYDELRQIELNKIAKIAAIDDVGSATATLQLILVSDLEALAKSQSTADAAKYQALADYITLLGVAKNEAGIAADAAYAAEVKANTLKFQAQADYMSLLTQQENEALAGVLYVESAQSKADENKHVALTDYISLLADAESAALAVAAAVASIPTVITAPSAGTGSTLPVIPGGSGGGLGGINLTPKRAEDYAGTTNITVNTGPLLGTDETVQAAVQAAIQSLNRQGANTSYAGAI